MSRRRLRSASWRAAVSRAMPMRCANSSHVNVSVKAPLLPFFPPEVTKKDFREPFLRVLQRDFLDQRAEAFEPLGEEPVQRPRELGVRLHEVQVMVAGEKPHGAVGHGLGARTALTVPLPGVAGAGVA